QLKPPARGDVTLASSASGGQGRHSPLRDCGWLNAQFFLTMVEAVSAPRFSATSDTIDTSNRIQGRVERDLQAEGYPVVRSPYTFGFGAVHAIRIHEDGLDGGADPGHDGVVIAVWRRQGRS
ncbi:MAG: hypothetical protein AB7F22_04220, partial [Reyranella sp.]